MILNTHMAGRLLERHDLPTLPVRQPVLDAVRKTVCDDRRDLEQRIQVWPDGYRGVFRLGIPLDYYTGMMRYDEWAIPDSGSIGEIGWAEQPGLGQRLIVWRTAFGYPQHGHEADDSQPWRIADSEQHAVALLLASLCRQVSEEMSGLYYRKAMEDKPSYASTIRALRWHTQDALGKPMRNIVYVPGEAGARPYYDPAQRCFVPATPVRLTRDWHVKSYYLERHDGAWNDSSAHSLRVFTGYQRFHWHQPAGDMFLVGMRHHAKELDMTFGRKVPKYAQDMLRRSRRKIKGIYSVKQSRELYNEQKALVDSGNLPGEWKEFVPGIDDYTWAKTPGWMNFQHNRVLEMSEGDP